MERDFSTSEEKKRMSFEKALFAGDGWVRMVVESQVKESWQEIKTLLSRREATKAAAYCAAARICKSPDAYDALYADVG